jgi:hypothetical protein
MNRDKIQPKSDAWLIANANNPELTATEKTYAAALKKAVIKTLERMSRYRKDIFA